MKNVIISTSRMVKSIMLLAMLLLTYSAWGQQNWLPNHPRLLFTGAETSEVKELIKNEPLAGELALYLKAEADSIAEAPQLPYEMDKYGNMLWTSRAYVYRLGTLSLAYRIYGEDKYLKAANDAILWVCNFPDWDPKHYLDTAEMTTAVAIAYDWLFAELPQATKQLVKASIYKNAIHRVLREYEKGGPGSWAKRETNWNVVCNTGMVLGALAVAEDYPQETGIILENAARYMPNCLKLFAPDIRSISAMQVSDMSLLAVPPIFCMVKCSISPKYPPGIETKWLKHCMVPECSTNSSFSPYLGLTTLLPVKQALCLPWKCITTRLMTL